jgi:hypothetical protein
MVKPKNQPQPASPAEPAPVGPAAGEKSLRLEWRSPAELAENPRNWRTHPAAQIAALTDVIGEVGWAGACLFNERTGRLIDGHARRKAALEQGTEAVPVLIGDWSEEQEAKILATLDPLAAMAEADAGKLEALLAEVNTGSKALQAMLAELGGSGGEESSEVKEITVQPPPEMVWLLIGIPLDAFGDVQEHVVGLQERATIHVQSNRSEDR